MVKEFIKSEKYRKYIIQLQFNSLRLFTVWGTDMQDDEKDKLLVKDDKLIAYQDLKSLTEYLRSLIHPFKDNENFENWILEENLEEVYSIYNMQLLENFDDPVLENKNTSIDLLNSLNLIQDFCMQTNLDNLICLCEDHVVIELKDFIYNSFFWKRSEQQRAFPNNISKIKYTLKTILDIFENQIEIDGITGNEANSG